jgi:SAM-dependent methyltransferase
MDPSGVLERWQRDLAAWAIPEHIAARASESPWELPRGVFVRRAEHSTAARSGPSFERAWEALEQPGSVLDVGAGAGAASLPLADRATGITAVDSDRGMLDAFAERVGVPFEAIEGRWPDVAGRAPVADVVTCHHVFYNVPDLGPFALALDAHGRRRVVVELTARHPVSWLNPLWQRFHGIERPSGPTAADALAVLRALGLQPEHQAWQRPGRTEYQDRTELVEMARRRLCLPPDRFDEVAAALDVSTVGIRDLVTIWWTPSAE